MIGPTKLCPNGIGLAFFDLDDTILTGGNRISPRVVDAISLAREEGCVTCVSSGRPLHMIPDFLSVPDAMDYLVCTNGSQVFRTPDAVLYERLMDREAVLGLMDALEPLSPGWNAFFDGRSYFEWRCFSYLVAGRRTPPTSTSRRGGDREGLLSHARHALHFARLAAMPRGRIRQVRRVRSHLEGAREGIQKVGCSLPSAEACDRALAVIAQLGSFEVARMSATELEVTAIGVNKASAARWLMDQLDIDASCAVAFGDSENDAPLAEVCGTFVAMQNGDGRVKELASDVCESVFDDGVARWLERAMSEANEVRHV